MPFYVTQILYNLYNYDIPISTDTLGRYHRNSNVIDTGVVIVDETNYQHFMGSLFKVGCSCTRPFPAPVTVKEGWCQ